MVMSPHHATLATAGVDGLVQVWDVTDAARLGRLSTIDAGRNRDTAVAELKPVHRLAFDPTGRLLAAPAKQDAQDAVDLWNLNDPRAPRRIETTSPDPNAQRSRCLAESVGSLAFSPSGGHFVGSCVDRWQVWSYNADPGTEKISPAAAMTGGSMQGILAFDPGDTARLLSATDRGVRVWDLSNPESPGAEGFLPTTPTAGRGLAYRSAGRRQLLAVPSMGSYGLWDVTNTASPRLLSKRPAPEPASQVVELSPDGSILAAAEADPGTKAIGVALRSTTDPNGPPLAVIDSGNHRVHSIVFNPAKPLLAVSTDPWGKESEGKPTLRLYDIADPRHPHQITELALADYGIAFSPDGEALTAVEALLGGDRDKEFLMEFSQRLRTWDLTNPAHPVELWTRELPTSGWGSEFAYRPDGALFVSYDTGVLRIWHVERHQLVGDPVTVPVSKSGTGPLEFSPDGTRLAVVVAAPDGRSDTLTRPEIWNVTQPDSPARESSLPASEQYAGDFDALTFGLGGQVLAVREGQGVTLWDSDPQRITASLCDTVGDPMTRQQWKLYLPDRPYQPPCR